MTLQEKIDEEVLEVIARQVKQRQESIDQFSQAGRTEMASREAAEMVVLKAYLPTQLTSDETATAVDAAIAETGATQAKQMGLVMQAVMAKHKGRIDGKLVNELVRQKLG
jgi:uncharacterized protein YqeY